MPETAPSLQSLRDRLALLQGEYEQASYIDDWQRCQAERARIEPLIKAVKEQIEQMERSL